MKNEYGFSLNLKFYKLISLYFQQLDKLLKKTTILLLFIFNNCIVEKKQYN